MSKIEELFGINVFSDAVMQKMLSPNAYDQLNYCINNDISLPIELANVVANALKDWAINKGATHYTHWFQPMTGVTAEKHESFIASNGHGGVIMELTGKELIKGEPDASSFPSGGLRATFEARGYTAWDPTSYAFIKDNTLCIPTAFCSYNGEALDKKTPLLRSMEALNKQALKVLTLLNKTDVKRVSASVGPEQEYFLIDKDLYQQREDLVLTGRTLFGARPPKGQELDDHYYGAINSKIYNYMSDLDHQLWECGIYAKTKHNEVAPSQYELAPIHTTVNISTDQNQLTMEIMKKVASKHNLACLLTEKPFLGVNGSGKHNNWSLITDAGVNLYEPTNNPYDNLQFLLFLCAVIKGVDEYADLLRISVATAGNDHRLGAQEAPPAVVSIYLGQELTNILEAIENDNSYFKKDNRLVEIGVHVLPKLIMDSTDRNRTSPFAFTGNKFEFRMLGSASSIADTNTVLNTIVANSLSEFALILENDADITHAISSIIKDTMHKHKRIIFNGNSYSPDWISEAKSRGLPNYVTAVDALAHLTDKKNIDLFVKHKVFTENELRSREDVYIENYCHTTVIEAMTMLDMARKYILPSCITYINELSQTLTNLKNCSINNVELLSTLNTVNDLYSIAVNNVNTLEESARKSTNFDNKSQAIFIRDTLLCDMNQLREVCDRLESIVPKKYWAYPTYSDLLYFV